MPLQSFKLAFILSLILCSSIFSLAVDKREPLGSDLLQSSSRNFVAYHRKGEEKLAQFILKSAENARQKVLSQLPQPLPVKANIILCSTFQEFKTRCKNQQENTLACALAEKNVIFVNLARWKELPAFKFEQILIHEYGHLYLGMMAKRQLPRWLEEGIVMHLAGQWGFFESISLSFARLFGRLIPISKLEFTFPAEKKAASLAYQESYAMADFIIKTKYQAEGLKGFIIDLIDKEQGSRFIENFWNPYIRDGLESQWRSTLSRHLHNWILFISYSGIFWFVLSLVFIYAYLKKRRRKLQKLQLWEKEEQQSPSPWE